MTLTEYLKKTTYRKGNKVFLRDAQLEAEYPGLQDDSIVDGVQTDSQQRFAQDYRDLCKRTGRFSVPGSEIGTAIYESGERGSVEITLDKEMLDELASWFSLNSETWEKVYTGFLSDILTARDKAKAQEQAKAKAQEKAKAKDTIENLRPTRPQAVRPPPHPQSFLGITRARAAAREQEQAQEQESRSSRPQVDTATPEQQSDLSRAITNYRQSLREFQDEQRNQHQYNQEPTCPTPPDDYKPMKAKDRQILIDAFDENPDTSVMLHKGKMYTRHGFEETLRYEVEKLRYENHQMEQEIEHRRNNDTVESRATRTVASVAAGSLIYKGIEKLMSGKW